MALPPAPGSYFRRLGFLSTYSISDRDIPQS